MRYLYAGTTGQGLALGGYQSVCPAGTSNANCSSASGQDAGLRDGNPDQRGQCCPPRMAAAENRGSPQKTYSGAVVIIYISFWTEIHHVHVNVHSQSVVSCAYFTMLPRGGRKEPTRLRFLWMKACKWLTVGSKCWQSWNENIFGNSF